jgi:uncharacterized repeat protein (TIGR01451 family)
MLASTPTTSDYHRRAAAARPTHVLAMAGFIVGAVLSFAVPTTSHAQGGLLPGEAFVTRFSGTTTVTGAGGPRTVIDLAGTVGTAIDLRAPGFPPDGRLWPDVPRPFSVTAGDVGQVFGVALDDANPPNIYLTATSAFGLHRNADNSDWMPGMWGPGGGPGTVYRLSAANDYRAERLADITLDGRANSGAALGNIAFDPWHHQLFVSDLETGMIHRIALADGADLGRYDHGVTGRASFTDAASGTVMSLPPVAFDPATSAHITDCPGGSFANQTSCWSFADFHRRAWGLGVGRDTASGIVRLYYSIWASDGFGNTAWFTAGDEQRNSVWSIALADTGGFDTTSVRREFFLPNFYNDPAAMMSRGPSRPVSDIALPHCGDATVMLLAERGSVRNLGFAPEAPFAFPHEARLLRFERDAGGVWHNAGRSDIGFYDRANEGQPYLRANCAGGTDFGYGYRADGTVDLASVEAFQWATGDRLCSPLAGCVDTATGAETDHNDVTGLQGNASLPTDELMPAAALQPYPVPGPATPAVTPRRSYMIDADNVIDRNDATKVGDVAIYRQCAAGPGVPGIYIPGYWPPPGEPCPYDLAVRKTGPEICEEGGECTFTVAVTNRGPLPYVGSLFLQDASDVATALLGTSPDWTCHLVEGAIDCFHPELTLQPGESVALELTVRLPHDIDGEAWTNCIHLVWPLWEAGNDYVVTIWVEEALFFMGYLPEAEVDGFVNPVTEDAIRHYQHDHGLPETGVIDNTLRESLFPHGMGLIGDCDPGNDQDCHTVHIPRRPFDLRLDKTGPAFCEAGGECTYQVTVTNTGPDFYSGPFSVVDTVPAGAELVGNSGPWTCHQPGGPGTNVTCNSNADITLDSAASVSFDITFRLPDPVGGHTVTDRACLNWGTMAPVNDANPANDCDEAVTPVPQPRIDLDLQKIGPHVCTPGANCTFLIGVHNNGPDAFQTPLTVSDDVPDGAVLFGAAPPSWTCHQPGGAGGNITCTLPPGITIPSGGTYGLVITLTLPADLVADTITDHACIAWSAMPSHGDTNAANDCDDAVTNIPHPIAFDLRIQKTAPPTCLPGGECSFVITLTYDGPDFATGIVLDDVLPAATAGVTADPPWTCVPVGTHMRCIHPAMPFTAGDSVALTLHWRPAGEASGAVENCVNIDWSGMALMGDRDPTNDHACATTNISQLISAADLAVATGGPPSCVRGGPCGVSITLANIGSEVVTARLSITAATSPPVPIGAVTALGDPGWSCSLSGSGYECRHNPLTLRPKETQRFQATLQIPSTFAGNSVTHSVKLGWIAGQGDANRANDSASVVIPIVNPACTGGRVWNGQACVCRGNLTWNGTACVEPTPTCTGGRYWNGQACVCRGNLTWNGTACVEPTPTCTGGRYWNGQACVCRGNLTWNGTACVQPTPTCTGGRYWNGQACVCKGNLTWNGTACVQPTPTCTGGRYWNGQACVCRGNLTWNGTACVQPTPQIQCSGGTVSNNQCICPRGMEARRVSATVYRCVKSQEVTPLVVCSGGTVRNGQCICPAGTTRQQTATNAYRCAPTIRQFRVVPLLQMTPLR